MMDLSQQMNFPLENIHTETGPGVIETAITFDDAFVDHFAASRELEEHEFHKHITDWEMQRYFEII